MQSKYAKIIYLFENYREGGIHSDNTLEHLRQFFVLENRYSDWYSFKRYLLPSAIGKINIKTDMIVIGKRDDYYNCLAGILPDMGIDEYLSLLKRISMEVFFAGSIIVLCD